MRRFEGPVYRVPSDTDITGVYATTDAERRQRQRQLKQQQRRDWNACVILAIVTVIAIYGSMYLVAWGMAAYQH